ncbi:uncharacterized protein TNCV_3131731 [Trichonephila clavipes]|nr:uncharacterized protein TNCV_3131731 [Trichonephila clavipes]
MVKNTKIKQQEKKAGANFARSPKERRGVMDALPTYQQLLTERKRKTQITLDTFLMKRQKIGNTEDIWLATLTAVPFVLGSNPGEDMGICKCIVTSWHEGTLNSRRAASPLVRLVELEEGWEAPAHPKGVLPQNWG